MAELLGIIFNVIGPIFLIIGVVWVVARTLNPDPRPLSTLLIYLFLPALAFRGMAQTDVSGDEIGGLGLVAVLMMLLMVGIGSLIARQLKLDRRTSSALILSLMLVNAANYGIPLNTFAFGSAGEERAIVYWLFSVVLGNFLGVFVASRGSGSTRDAIVNALRVPIAHAAVLGLIVNLAEISVPVPVFRAVDILAEAAIPGMLTLLGLRLAHAKLGGQLRLILLASGVRLLLAPLIAVPMALLLGLQGVTFSVAVVESSMPTAVVATAFAMQFGSDAEFTSAVTLVTTAASVVTLSVLLLLLGVGA